MHEIYNYKASNQQTCILCNYCVLIKSYLSLEALKLHAFVLGPEVKLLSVAMATLGLQLCFTKLR